MPRASRKSNTRCRRSSGVGAVVAAPRLAVSVRLHDYPMPCKIPRMFSGDAAPRAHRPPRRGDQALWGESSSRSGSRMPRAAGLPSSIGSCANTFEPRACDQLSAVERRGQRRLVHDAAAGDVHEDGRVASSRPAPGADQPPRVVVQRRVHRDRVRPAQQFGKRHGGVGLSSRTAPEVEV